MAKKEIEVGDAVACASGSVARALPVVAFSGPTWGVQYVRVKANSFDPGVVPPAAVEKTGLRFGCGAMESVGQSRRDEPKPAQGGADASGASEAQPWVGGQTQRQKPEGLALVGGDDHAATVGPGMKTIDVDAWFGFRAAPIGAMCSWRLVTGVARWHVPHAAPPRAVIGLCLRHGRGPCASSPQWNKTKHAEKDQFLGYALAWYDGSLPQGYETVTAARRGRR